jgi:hypothetical protein
MYLTQAEYNKYQNKMLFCSLKTFCIKCFITFHLHTYFIYVIAP